MPDNQGDVELYIKAGPDETSVGDCPFAHYVRCVLHVKGIEYTVIPSVQSTKPEWLTNDPKLDGKMPCLRKGDFKLVESSTIVEYLEAAYPEPSLSTPSNMESSFLVQSGFFPALATFVKSGSFSSDLESKLFDQLESMEAHLLSDYFSGTQVSLVDYSLAPKLYHMRVVLQEFYPQTREKVKEKCPKLEKYMDAMFNEEAFKATKYPPQTVVWGWTNARKSAQQK